MNGKNQLLIGSEKKGIKKTSKRIIKMESKWIGGGLSF